MSALRGPGGFSSVKGKRGKRVWASRKEKREIERVRRNGQIENRQASRAEMKGKRVQQSNMGRRNGQ